MTEIFWRTDMARPSKCRKICSEPDIRQFQTRSSLPMVQSAWPWMSLKLYAWLTWNIFTHEKCAKQMEISRTTVTEIYESARYKIADSLIHGKTLLISGGHYRLCQGDMSSHCFTRCTSAYDSVATSIIEKKENGTMRIAATYENGMIFQHFGHTETIQIVRYWKWTDYRNTDCIYQRSGTWCIIRISDTGTGWYPDLRRYRWRCTGCTRWSRNQIIWWCVWLCWRSSQCISCRRTEL